MFWTTELVSAFSTIPPRNIVKLFAQACTRHTGSCSALVRLLCASQAPLTVEAHSQAASER